MRYDKVIAVPKFRRASRSNLRRTYDIPCLPVHCNYVVIIYTCIPNVESCQTQLIHCLGHHCRGNRE